LPSDLENFISIMIRHDGHKISGSPPPWRAVDMSTYLYILHILCPHILWLCNTLIFVMFHYVYVLWLSTLL
jgi:hypothetical protein